MTKEQLIDFAYKNPGVESIWNLALDLAAKNVRLNLSAGHINETLETYSFKSTTDPVRLIQVDKSTILNLKI